jgi:phosphoacetylglucosamine mutase
VYNSIAAEFKISAATPAKVVYARDTRASGSRLVNALVAALDAAETISTDYKISTTPQLHYYTCCLNTANAEIPYGTPTEQGYYEKMADAYLRSMKHVAGTTGHVTVDCANGVGGPKLNELLKYLPQKGADKYLDIRVVNDEVHKPDALNVQVCRTTGFRCSEVSISTGQLLIH